MHRYPHRVRAPAAPLEYFRSTLAVKLVELDSELGLRRHYPAGLCHCEKVADDEYDDAQSTYEAAAV